MGLKKRQYTKEQKEELVQALLSGQTALGLGREYNISPGLINRWRRQYLNGQLGKNDNNQEIKKLQIQIAKLEQMIGKLTIENYLLKKEKEYMIQTKKEDSSIVTGNCFTPSRKDAD
jgi:transposase-like protein